MNTTTATPPLVDRDMNPIAERVEVTVTKEKLQFAIWFIGILLSVLSFFSWKVLAGIDTLKENSADFKTYIKTNDQRILYLEQNLNSTLKQLQEAEARVKNLEEKDFNFWKDYGWLFREAQTRK